MATREQQIAEAAVRILKKSGGGMPWQELFDRLDGHLLLCPSYAEILAAIDDGLMKSGRATYRGDFTRTLVVWLTECAPPVPPVDVEAIDKLCNSMN